MPGGLWILPKISVRNEKRRFYEHVTNIEWVGKYQAYISLSLDSSIKWLCIYIKHLIPHTHMHTRVCMYLRSGRCVIRNTENNNINDSSNYKEKYGMLTLYSTSLHSFVLVHINKP